MKITKTLISTSIAMAMSMGTAALFPMAANAEAVNWESYIKNAPEWIPNDFDSAMDFCNTYGATKVDKDTICIVRNVPDTCRMNADITPVFNTDARADSNYESHIYSFDFKLPEAPDKSDEKAYANYLREMKKYEFAGINDSSSVGFHYEALVILNNAADGFNVKVSLENPDTDKPLPDDIKYSFTKQDGELVQTDIYSWLPDSIPEFNAFRKENGNISFRDGRLIYCDSINYSTGAKMDTEQTGTGRLDIAMTEHPHYDYVMQPTGNPTYFINIYQGGAEGDVDITFKSGIPWAPAETHRALTASVHVDENMNITTRTNSLPDWIPQDHESAVAFSNEHGTSFVRDGIICFVRPLYLDSADRYPVRFEGSAAKDIKSFEVFNKTFVHPEINYKGYIVTAYDIPKDSDLTVDLMYSYNKEKERLLNSYSFQKDSSGYVTQTDKFFWLPDSVDEFNRYYEKNGSFSIQDGYIMYCTDLVLSKSEGLSIKTEGSGSVIEEYSKTIKKDYHSIDSSEPKDENYHAVKLLKPTKAGSVKLTIVRSAYIQGKGFTSTDESAYFRITDDLKIIPAEKEELMTNIKGDCNGDGILGISDAVSLQRWLLGKGGLSEFGMADINGDGTVDVFDLIAVKKQLLLTVREEPRPVMIFIRENFAWMPTQTVIITDQYGRAYESRYFRDYSDWDEIKRETLSMYNDNWYEKVKQIMASASPSAGFIPDKILEDVNALADKAAEYSNIKMYSEGMMCDYGNDSLYIIGTDADGAPISAAIASFGDFSGWIDMPEIKDFIKELAINEIYGQNLVYSLSYDVNAF